MPWCCVMLCEMCMWKLMAEQSECDVVSCCTFLWVHIQLHFCISERMKTVLRFKLYELRALYQVQVLIVYIYICIYIYLVHTMLIIYHWDNHLRFRCGNIWIGKKLIMSRNVIAVRKEIVLRGKPFRRTLSSVC